MKSLPTPDFDLGCSFFFIPGFSLLYIKRQGEEAGVAEPRSYCNGWLCWQEVMIKETYLNRGGFLFPLSVVHEGAAELQQLCLIYVLLVIRWVG